MSELQNLSPVDRISNLPDSLLCHILSFLSTEEVVATSILSSRWTTLWTHVPHLHFKYFKDSRNYWSDQDEDEDDHDDNEKRMSFTFFVYRVLTLLKAPTVETFRLECREEIEPLHVNTWICAALGRGVKELHLSSSCNTIKLPRSAFTCESLVVLKLNELICPNCPSHIHLPSLKILHIGKVICGYLDEDSVVKLISGCPILEELDIERDLRHETTFYISIPTLKILRVRISEAIPESKVQISTPSLVRLVIEGTYPPDYLLDKLPNLVEAKAVNYDDNYGENYGDFVLKLLRELYNVKILSFSYIPRGNNISFDDIPLFHNLVNLELSVDSFYCHVLKILIDNSPNLKVLKIYKTERHSFQGNESCWSQPSRGPGCLSNLETLHVIGLGKFDDLEFVKYILKNAQVLVTATVICSHYLEDWKEKFDLLKKLSMFPRGSKTCQLAFD